MHDRLRRLSGRPRSTVPVTDVSQSTGPREQPGSDSGRLRVLELLRQAPAEGRLGVTDLADRSGLHPNTVRFHLNRLVAAGLVRREVEQRSGPGRPRLSFAAVPEQEVYGGGRNYQLLASMLAGFMTSTLPDPAPAATELGRSWGRYLARRPAPAQRVTEDEALKELVRVLDDVGFAPQLALDEDRAYRVLLRHCPFLEVAAVHRDVVCSIHLGVMQGVLAEQHAPVEATELQPFAEPSLCVARLSGSSQSDSRA